MLSWNDIKAFSYGVLRWSERDLNECTVDYFVHTIIGWKHNDLWQTQTTNNLNKRLAYAFAEIQTAQKRIDIEKYFELFEVKNIDIKKDLESASEHFPTTLNNGKK